MVVKIASYNSIFGSHNGELTEEGWTDYRVIARPKEPAESIVTVADPTGALFRTYGNDPTKDLAGAVARDFGGLDTVETTEANNAAADDMTLFPAAIQVGDAYFFGFDRPVSGMTLNVSTAGLGATATVDWEYSQGSGIFAALAGGTQGNYADFTDFTVAEHDISWTVPGDWATDDVSTVSGLYWIKVECDARVGGETPPKGQQAWTSEIFVGPGRITIENPAATDIYDGRILKASFDDGSRTLQLHCKDWLSQLDDPIVTIDMREDLDGNGLREAQAHSDADGAFVGVAQNAAGTFFFFDDGPYDDDGARAWANDQFNGMKLVFATSMAGKKTWRFHPYQGTTNDADNTIGGAIENLWVLDGLVNDCSDNGDYETDYDFRAELGHNTPSDFYVHDTIVGARVMARFQVGGGAANHTHLEIEDQSNPGTYFTLIKLEEFDHFQDHICELDADQWPNIVAADGTATVRFDVDRAGGAATLGVSYLYLEVDVETVGYAGAITIDDTFNPNKLEVATDLTAQATQIWEKINYSIVKEVYKHIDTAEGGTLITDYDTLVPLTAAANIEHTSGFSTRRYENSTPLADLQDLANIDKVAFCLPLGSLDLLWKSTFNDGAPTALTDASVLRWGGEHSFIDVRNGYILYGPKVNDLLIRLDTADIVGGDPGSDSKALYGVTRSAVVKNAGVNTEYELSQLGSALVERDEDVLLFLNCDIAGLSALRLLDEVSITSTYMGLVAEKYVVTYWEFSYSENITKLRLHPRNSTKGFVQHKIFSDSIRRLVEGTEQIAANVDYLRPEITTE